MGIVIMLFIVEIFSTILQRVFCESTLVRKRNNECLNISVWAGYFIIFNLVTYAVANYIGTAWLNLLVFVLIFFVTIRVLYSNPVRTLIAVTVFMYLSGMCAELFVYYGKELLPWEIDWNGDLLYTVLSKIVWLLIIKLASILVKMRRKMELGIQDWLEVFIVPVGSVWIMLAIFLKGTLENYVLGFIAVTMILLINIFTYYLYDKAKETMENRMRQELLAKQCAYYVRQNRESKEWWEELQQFRHNMKQHFILERAYLESRDYDALEKYCNENLDFLSMKRNTANSGNVYIDSIVNYKADAAQKEGVKFYADIRIPKDAELNAEDISICLGNLLDNAIEAVRNLKHDKVIHVNLYADNHNLFINIINNHNNTIQKERNRYLSSKKEGRGHGLGLLIVRQIVDKYGGEMTIQDEGGKFDVTIVAFDFFK